MFVAVNSMIGAQSDSTGRGAGGSESGKESGTLESRASKGTKSVFGSITVEVAAPEAVSSHPSSVCAAGSESRVRAGSCAASRALSGCRAKSCPNQVSADVSREVQTSKSDLTAKGVAFDLLQMAKRIGPQCKAAEYEDLSEEKTLTLDHVVVDD